MESSIRLIEIIFRSKSKNEKLGSFIFVVKRLNNDTIGPLKIF